MSKGKNVLTTGDVAKICHVAPRTVSKWFDSGQLKGYRIPGSKDRRIPLSELVRFMKANNIPADALCQGSLRVLIVDSDKSTVLQLAERLGQKADYEIQIVCSDFETGVIAGKFTPHVLLVNLLAEDINTTDILKNIRDNEELQTIRIIAIGNKLADAELTALVQKGFDGYISDITDINEIIKTIEEVTAIVY